MFDKRTREDEEAFSGYLMLVNRTFPNIIPLTFQDGTDGPDAYGYMIDCFNPRIESEPCPLAESAYYSWHLCQYIHIQQLVIISKNI